MALQRGSSPLYVLWLADLDNRGDPVQLTSNEPGTWDSAPVWDPHGKEVLFKRTRRSSDGGLHASTMRINMATREISELFPETEGTSGVAYSPEGQRLVFWSKNVLSCSI